MRSPSSKENINKSQLRLQLYFFFPQFLISLSFLYNNYLSLSKMEEKQNLCLKSQKSLRRTIIRNRQRVNIEIPTYHKYDESNLLSYMSNFDFKLEEKNINQLEMLKKNYRFYLQKIEKLQSTKQALKERLQNFPQMIQNSQSIIQSENNIKFIEMILSEANEKVAQISKRVQNAKQKKKKTQSQIHALKKEIKEQKDYFFQLKREQLAISNELQEIQKAYERELADDRFKEVLASKFQTTRNHSKKPTIFMKSTQKPENDGSPPKQKSKYSQPDNQISFKDSDISPSTEKKNLWKTQCHKKKGTISIFINQSSKKKLSEIDSEVLKQGESLSIGLSEKTPLGPSTLANQSKILAKNSRSLFTCQGNDKMIKTSQIKTIENIKQECRKIYINSKSSKINKQSLYQEVNLLRERMVMSQTLGVLSDKMKDSFNQSQQDSTAKYQKYTKNCLKNLKEKLDKSKIRLPEIKKKANIYQIKVAAFQKNSLSSSKISLLHKQISPPAPQNVDRNFSNFSKLSPKQIIQQIPAQKFEEILALIQRQSLLCLNKLQAQKIRQ